MYIIKHVSGIYILGKTHIRVGVVRYSNEGVMEFGLNQYFNKEALKVAIRQIPYMDNLTNTAHGLHLMRTLMFDPRNRGVGGDRIDVPNVALIITDGASNVDADRTISNNLLFYDENLKKGTGILLIKLSHGFHFRL